ncbi:MAG: LamG domain-containing protein, partial [Candidatus Pacearchaeota archaeon]|nr:LamG domain-containing protein [Candidatus Pacearchaeota archaeon]
LDYSGLVESIEVAPVLANEDGKEKVYDTIDVEKLSLEQSLKSLGIVSWWKMNGNAEDEVGENDGELYGDTDCSVEGVYDKACSFDGSGDYVNVGSYDFAEGAIFLWFKGYSDSKIFMGRRELSKRIYIGAHENILVAGVGDQGWDVIRGITDISEGESWHCAVLSWDSENVNLYLDSSLEYSASQLGTTNSNQNFSIGAVNDDGSVGNYWDGLIDEVMIFNKVLTDEQVEWLYAQDLS